MISISNLTKTYAGQVHALRGLDLEIGSGMFGLVGPNGAGKTTLKRIVSGLLHPTNGAVRVFDQDVTTPRGKLATKAILGYMPQELGLYPNLTAREFLDYIAILKGVTDRAVRRQQVNDVLQHVRLSDEADRQLKTYSGGMKRRVGIAQALLGNPQLLIVDEPTAGLDPEERVRLRNLLADMAARRTVILSTHIVEDISQSCTWTRIRERRGTRFEHRQFRSAKSFGTQLLLRHLRHRHDLCCELHRLFAMECYEERLITKEHTGGLELNFGNGAAALELLHQMARGEGFGVIVGQGVRYMKEYFAREFGADPVFMHDIGMEIKGMEISEYMTKESLAQKGGYGLATKGPQHDEAWLIFMDQVHNLLPTVEIKAEALHYFPMWRTWFSLHGLCKLPWNDISPANNKQTKEPAKVEEHVENYTWIHQGVTGKPTKVGDLLGQSERVYNFQKVFALRMGRA